MITFLERLDVAGRKGDTNLVDLLVARTGLVEVVFLHFEGLRGCLRRRRGKKGG